MTTRIGRLELSEDIVNEVRLSGDQLAVSGDFCPDDVEDGAAIRDDLAALLNNPDEPVVPFTSTADPSFDGMYEVTGGEVSSRGGSWLAGIWDWSLTLRRVSDSTAIVESRQRGTTLTNDNSGVATHWHAAPHTAGMWSFGGVDGGVATRQRFSETGDVVIRWTSAPADFADIVATWEVEADDWYDGAAYVQAPSGRKVIGRPTIATNTITLANGNFRVDLEPNDDADWGAVLGGEVMAIRCYVWDGGGPEWDEVAGWLLQWLDAPGGTPIGFQPFRPFTTVEVVANGPEFVAVAVRMVDFNTGSQVRLTVGLRRGAMHAGCHVASEFVSGWQLTTDAPDGAGNAANLDAGYRQLGNSAEGHRWVLGIADDSVGGVGASDEFERSSGSTTSLSFALGVEYEGSSADPGNEAQDVIDQWLSTQTERWQVIG